MNKYNKKGMYNGYDKNHKERDALDFYSTPVKEVKNILNTLNINFDNTTILEPSAGAGHMVKAIMDYSKTAKIIATDVANRQPLKGLEDKILSGEKYDFLNDNYPFTEDIDYIIMNPPYSTIEPFTMRALGIAKKKLIMLGRLQFLEGVKRYENIFSLQAPNDVYVYVDRIACYKNGDETITPNSAQAYAWFIFDIEHPNDISRLHWIRRA